MSRSALILGFVAASLPMGCVHSLETDVSEVASRYSHRQQGTCSSWLNSYKTGYEYCASPKVSVKVEPPLLAAGAGAAAAVEIDPNNAEQMMTEGGKLYEANCGACHMADGMGLAGAFPPLAKSDYLADLSTHLGVIINGLSGPIVVNGQPFDGIMPPQGQLSDLEIAAISTYERNTWGNELGAVTPDDVKAAR